MSENIYSGDRNLGRDGRKYGDITGDGRRWGRTVVPDGDAKGLARDCKYRRRGWTAALAGGDGV